MKYVPHGRPRGCLNTATIAAGNQIVEELSRGPATSFALRATLELSRGRFHRAVKPLLKRGRIRKVGQSWREGAIYAP